jgi:hypothetical protein
VVSSSCDLEKFCTLSDRVLRCDRSRTTSLCHQGDGNASSLFHVKIAAAGFHGVRGLHDPCDPLVNRVDIPVVLLLLHGPLALRLKKSSPGFSCLNAYVSNCEQIGHHSRLLHGDLLHSLDVADSTTEGVDDLDVLDIWDGISGIAEIFHVVPEALIMLLFDGLQSLNSRWTLVCALEVPDEHGT